MIKNLTAYDLSKLNLELIQIFINIMSENGYKCYNYKVIEKLWYAVFDEDNKNFVYIVPGDFYKTPEAALDRLHQLTKYDIVNITTPDVRYKI